MVKDLIKDIQLEEHYEGQNTDDAMDRWMNVNELINSIEDYNERFPTSGLEKFLEESAIISIDCKML